MWRLVLLALLLVSCEEVPDRTYDVEFFYVINHKVTAKTYNRIETLFAKAYPRFDLRKLEPSMKSQRLHYGIYRSRLVGKPGVETDGPLPKGEFAKLQKQIVRELRVRAIFDHLLAEAGKKGGIKAIFDHLVAKDDPKRRICGNKPGKDLLVYRRVRGTMNELMDLKDGKVRFGLEVGARVSHAAGDDGRPAFVSRPTLLGDYGMGCQIFRILKVQPAPKRAAKEPPNRR